MRVTKGDNHRMVPRIARKRYLEDLFTLSLGRLLFLASICMAMNDEANGLVKVLQCVLNPALRMIMKK